MGAPPARCRRRSRLHRASFSAVRQLPYRLDDAARLLHRLPMGSGCARQTRRLPFPATGHLRTLSNRRTARFSPAPNSRHCHHAFPDHAELPRHSRQRHVPKLGHIGGACGLSRSRICQRTDGLRVAHAAPFQPRSARFHFAHPADRAVLCHRFRVRAQSCGRIAPRLSARKFLQGHCCRADGRCRVLCTGCRRGLLYCAVARTSGQALCHPPLPSKRARTPSGSFA